jgi:hypothetical protein
MIGLMDGASRVAIMAHAITGAAQRIAMHVMQKAMLLMMQFD